MTAPPPTDDGSLDDLDLDDAAVLAVLDETATAAQRRQVARRPDLLARLAQQQRAVDALGAPVAPLPDDVADRIRNRALSAGADSADGGAAPEVEGPAEAGPSPARVVPLVRAPRRRRWPAWPAVAAVVILLMGLGTALIVNDRDRSDQVAETSADLAAEEAARELGQDAANGSGGSTAASDEDATDSWHEDAAEGPASSPAAGADLSDLPRYPDQAALERELRTVDPSTLLPPSAGSDGSATTNSGELRASDQAAFCEAGLRAADPALDPVEASRLVVVDDVEVLVVSQPVRATAEGAAATRLTALEARSCTPLFAVQR